MGFITANRNQTDMIGYSLADFVESKSLCARIVRIVDDLDLSALYSDYSSQGGDAYDPKIMLSIWFLAYCEGITSTRRVEQLCKRDTHYIYISANLKPDHCSLSRFRQRHAKVFPEIFIQIVRRAHELGMSKFKRISIDGSKLMGNASKKAGRTPARLKAEMEALDADIKDYLKDCDKDDPQVQEALQKAQARMAKLEEAADLQKKRSQDLSPKYRDRHQVNLTDPDARSMTISHTGMTGCGYNVQIAVDNQTQIIAHIDVVDDANDRKQFASMHQGCEKTLGNHPDRQYTADSGYHSFDQLEYINENKIDAVLAEPRIRTRSCDEESGYFHRGAFTYDSVTDSYTCPAGDKLTLMWREKKRNRMNKVYRADACVGCAMRQRCIKSNNSESLRTIRRDFNENLAEQMLSRSQSPEGKIRLKARAKSAEPVFGNLKHNRRFQRFSLRGLNRVRGEFALMCIGHNLGKIFGRSGPIGPNGPNTSDRDPKLGPVRQKTPLEVLLNRVLSFFDFRGIRFQHA